MLLHVTPRDNGILHIVGNKAFKYQGPRFVTIDMYKYNFFLFYAFVDFFLNNCHVADILRCIIRNSVSGNLPKRERSLNQCDKNG